jgi:predicted nucleic acid-binding protein
VVDASIAVQWFANEPGSANAAKLIEADTGLLAPNIMPVEAANAWWRKVRRGEMSVSDLDEAIVGLLSLGIDLIAIEALLGRAARLAVELNHPVYDCLYLALSADRGASLATADERLRRGATRLGIPLWQPLRLAKRGR